MVWIGRLTSEWHRKNLEGSGCDLIEVLTRHLYGRIAQSDESSFSGQVMSRQIFEQESLECQSRACSSHRIIRWHVLLKHASFVGWIFQCKSQLQNCILGIRRTGSRKAVASLFVIYLPDKSVWKQVLISIRQTESFSVSIVYVRQLTTAVSAPVTTFIGGR